MENPDYSQYELSDLYEVAQRFARERDEKCYAVVYQEIARREGVLNKNESYALRNWRDWLFEPGNEVRSAKNIIAWWEARRGFWNGFVAFLGFCAAFTLALLWLTAISRTPPFSWEVVGAGALITLMALFYIFIFWVFALIPINIVFCAAYLLDIVLNMPLRFLGWRLSVSLLSVSLFMTLLAATILLAALPVVGLIVEMTHK